LLQFIDEKEFHFNPAEIHHPKFKMGKYAN